MSIFLGGKTLDFVHKPYLGQGKQTKPNRTETNLKNNKKNKM